MGQVRHVGTNVLVIRQACAIREVYGWANMCRLVYSVGCVEVLRTLIQEAPPDPFTLGFPARTNGRSKRTRSSGCR